MVKQKFLLDTCVCIALLKDKKSIAERIQKAGRDRCFVSDITLAEMYFGACKSGRKLHFDDVKWIKKLFQVLPSGESYEEYGRTRWELEKSGQRIADMDLLIAATALHFKMTLVTGNTKHFERIEGLKVENWEQEN